MAGRADRAGHQFGAVAGAGAHIEHLHAGLHADEREQLYRIAALVGLAVGIAAIGRGHDRVVVLRPRRGRGARGRNGKHERCQQKFPSPRSAILPHW